MIAGVIDRYHVLYLRWFNRADVPDVTMLAEGASTITNQEPWFETVYCCIPEENKTKYAFHNSVFLNSSC